MTPERQKKIDDLHRPSNRFLEIVFGALLLLGISILLKPLLAALGFDMENYAWFTIVKVIYKYTGIILGILSILAICTTGILSFWATDEEKEEFKRAVKEAVQEVQKEEKTKNKTVYNGKSPLIDLEPKQIAIVHKILCDIPEENGHIRTSELIQVLRALAGQGDLDDGNKDALIAWVESITGKAVDARNFKYDYDNKYSEKGVSKQAEKIYKEFEKLR